VAQAIVGTWYDCSWGNDPSDPILRALGYDQDDQGGGLALTNDGYYAVLKNGPGVEPAVSTPNSGAFQSMSLTGTYQVVDASATLGAGSYQISFQDSLGNVHLARVEMLGSPTKMRLISGTPSIAEEFAPALPLTFRAGICNYAQFGPQLAPFARAAETLEGITGTWIWCAGPRPALNDNVAPIVGVEFPGDGTFHDLVEDGAGSVERGSGSNDFGPVVVSDDGTLSLIGAGGQGDTHGILPVLAACTSTLSFTWLLSGPVEQQPIFQRTTTSY
jgi:hypothetical protein